MQSGLRSWGRTFRFQHAVAPVEWRDGPLSIPRGLTALPQGLARSYGDSCLNEGGALLLTRKLDRFIAFDRATGLLRVEAGVSLDEIMRFCIPQGWFLAVVPGTKFVTVGGAIANDIHGKNHHRMGTFGCHVTAFELLRSDGTRIVCTPTDNVDYYRATIGGLGLTGLVTWADIQLRPIHNAFIAEESIRFSGLDDFFKLNEDSEKDFEYTVSWVDCSARGKKLGRGQYLRGNHAGPQFGRTPAVKPPLPLMVPFQFPPYVMSGPTIHAMNFVLYHKQLRKKSFHLKRFDPFFFPLDGIHNWSRIYGPRGFFQYQYVVPMEDSRAIVRETFELIAASGQASFLAVLKTFGDVPSPGMLSFPKPGVTLAVDFSNYGEKSLQLFRALDRVVSSVGGSLYPAKDSRMPPEFFRQAYPQWKEFGRYIDPRFSSSFWRRVTGALQESP
jgi:FAD/FMN-containing dehydrogenase